MRPPRPPSGKRVATDAPSDDVLLGSTDSCTSYLPPMETGAARKRSPSPTPHKRSSSLSRVGRDPNVNPHVSRQRSASPAAPSRPGTQQCDRDQEPEVNNDRKGGREIPIPDPARNAAEAARRGSEAIIKFERLSGLDSSDRTQMISGQTLAGRGNLSPMSAAGISSCLRLAQHSSSKAAGLQTVGSLTIGSLGASPVDSRQAGRGITLRVGQVGASPSSKLRVGGAPGGPKIAPSTLVARLFGELKQQAAVGPAVSPNPALAASAQHAGRKSPRTAMWASEIRAASMRFDESGANGNLPSQLQSMPSSACGERHLPADKDPWVALERLRLKPESAEFVYMIPYHRSKALPLNPYHLKVIAHAKIPAGKTYYTLSLGGVTTTRPGEEPELTHLEVWKRECFIFESLVGIPIFSQYKWWKNFKVWKENVKYSKFVKNRESFRKQSVLMNPIMFKTLLKLRDQTTVLETCSLFDDKHGTHVCTIDELSEMQQRQQVHFLRLLNRFWQKSVSSVRDGCRDVLEDFEKTFLSTGPKESAYAGVAGGKKTGRVSPAATANPAGGGDDDVFKYTMKAAMRVIHRQLYNFLLLCDYMTLHAIKVVVVDSTRRLCNRFDRSSEATEFAPIIVAPLSLVLDSTSGGAGHLVLKPSEMDLANEIQGIAFSFIKTMGSSPRLLDHEDLVEFYFLYDECTVSQMDQMLGTIIEESAEYKKLLQDMQEGFVRTYDKADEVIKKYEFLTEFVVANEEFDIGKVEVDAEANDSPFEDLLEIEAGFKVQLDQMLSVQDQVDCDALRVVCTTYKSQLMPSPTRCIKEIRELMPQLLARKQRRLLDQVVHANSILGRVPDNINDYMSYCSWLERIDKEQYALEEKIADANKSLYLLQENGMDLSTVDNITSSILQGDLKKLQNALSLALESREANNGRYVGVLEEMLLLFSEEISEMQMLLGDPILVCETGDTLSVLSTARDLSEQIGELEEKAQLIRTYQRTLRRPVGTFTELFDMGQSVRTPSVLPRLCVVCV